MPSLRSKRLSCLFLSPQVTDSQELRKSNSDLQYSTSSHTIYFTEYASHKKHSQTNILPLRDFLFSIQLIGLSSSQLPSCRRPLMMISLPSTSSDHPVTRLCRLSRNLHSKCVGRLGAQSRTSRPIFSNEVTRYSLQPPDFLLSFESYGFLPTDRRLFLRRALPTQPEDRIQWSSTSSVVPVYQCNYLLYGLARQPPRFRPSIHAASSRLICSLIIRHCKVWWAF